MRRISHITAVSVLASCAMVHAGPVLLASFDLTSGVGSAGTGPPPEHHAQFVLELRPFIIGDGPRIGLGLFWEDGDSGVADFTLETDSGFSGFADLATNGIDDWLVDLILFPDGGGSGGGAPESVRLGTSPDLIGYQLDVVRLIVHDVTIEPWSPKDSPELDGTRVLAHLTYEFYGTVIPEPATLSLLAAGAAYLLRRTTR